MCTQNICQIKKRKRFFEGWGGDAKTRGPVELIQ